MRRTDRNHTLCSHLGSGACFKWPSLLFSWLVRCFSAVYICIFQHFNPCKTKDPRAGAAGAGVTDAVEQPPQTDAEPEGKMNDKGADEAQREDEQPRENRGDEEVKSEEKEEEKKDEAAGRSY